MNSFLSNTFSFLKRYAVIVLASVVIGNLVVWKNQDKKGDYYQYVIKVRSRFDYYDLVRSNFEKIAAGILQNDSSKKNTHLKDASVELYRNEDIYFIEMKLQFTDTASVSQIIDQVIGFIKSDNEMKAKYFDRLDNLSKLIAEEKDLIRDIESQSDSGKERSVFTKAQLFHERIGQMNLMRDRDNFEQNISIHFPASNEYTFIQSDKSSKIFITATVLFFIIGLFIAVVVDRFRN